MADTPITATYATASTFTVASDKASEFPAGVRVLADCGVDGYQAGVSTGYASTTVGLTMDDGNALTANLVGVWHSNDTPYSMCNHGHTGQADGGDLPAYAKVDCSVPFTGGHIRGEGSYTGFFFTETDAPTDEKKWIYQVSNNQASLLAVNDAETDFNAVWTADRDGATPTVMTVNPLLIAAGGLNADTINGEDVTGGIVNKYLGLSVTSEVSITGATTLTPAAFGKMHVCTETTADYTVGLPAAAGNAGKLLGIRIANACTKLVTLDGNASELIDGAASRVMWAGESALLLCDGVGWTKVAGKSIPMVCRMSCPSGQSLPTSAYTSIPLPTTDINIGGMADAANNRIVARRAGLYNVFAQVSFQGAIASTNLAAQILANGGNVIAGSGPAAIYGVVVAPKYTISCAASQLLTLRGYHEFGSTLTTGLWNTVLSLEEIVSW